MRLQKVWIFVVRFRLVCAVLGFIGVGFSFGWRKQSEGMYYYAVDRGGAVWRSC
jgi:hypothetical protein